MDIRGVYPNGRCILACRLRDRNSAVLLVVRVHPVVHRG